MQFLNFRKQGGATFLVWLAAQSVLFAQLPNTDLYTIYPPLGRAGSTVEVSITGKPLEDISGLRFNNPGIKVKPLTTPANEVFPEPQPVKNRFEVTIARDVVPGIYEVRCDGYHGLSTARPFLVLPAGAKDRLEEGAHNKLESALPIQVNESVHGTIGAREIEWFKLDARKGERFFMTLWGERLDSKLDGQIRVYDETRRELRHNSEYFFRDPFVDFVAPADGEYFIAISDLLYRGGSQYFYRFEVHRNPHIDYVWPPAGVPGTKQSFTVYGRNLPGGKPVANLELGGHPIESLEVSLEIPKVPVEPKSFYPGIPRQAILPGFEYRLTKSNTAKIGFATAPVVLENSGAQHQSVTIPCEIAGKFDFPGDADTFRFTGKKEKTYSLEVYCDRIGVSADSVLVVKKVGDEEGTVLAENDDPPSYFSVDRTDATNFDTIDSSLRFTAPEDGEYEAVLINQSSSGSPAHLYRLAIREPVPDFQLLTATEKTVIATNGRAGYPAAPLLRKNGALSYRVAALRQDEFDGAITVSVEGLPPGVTAAPLLLHGSNLGGFLSVKADSNVKRWSGPIEIVGKAMIDGKEVVKRSRNASLVWGVIFADSFRVRSRLDLETVLSVTDQESAPCYIEAKQKAFTVELNGELEVPVAVTDFYKLRKGNLTVQPYGFPGLLRSPPKVTIAEGKSEGVLKISFKPSGNFKAAVGTYDFVLQGTGIAKHRTNVAAVARAEQEVVRLKTLHDTQVKTVADAKMESQQLDEARKKADTAVKGASPETKEGLGKTAAEAKEAADVAKKDLAAAEALLKEIASAIKTAEKNKTNAENTAKVTDTKFATCSPPITVTVTEPKKK